MNSDFVIFNPNRTNKWRIPYVWTGRHGWSHVTFMAHVYKDRASAERAIKRNNWRMEDAQYCTVDEFAELYGASPT